MVDGLPPTQLFFFHRLPFFSSDGDCSSLLITGPIIEHSNSTTQPHDPSAHNSALRRQQKPVDCWEWRHNSHVRGKHGAPQTGESRRREPRAVTDAWSGPLGEELGYLLPPPGEASGRQRSGALGQAYLDQGSSRTCKARTGLFVFPVFIFIIFKQHKNCGDYAVVSCAKEFNCAVHT